MGTFEIDFPALWMFITDRFRLPAPTLHGPDHWRRVEQNGLTLAGMTDADPLVVRLFAVLHDAERENESYDEAHGIRAAKLAQDLHGQWFQIEDEQLEQLVFACHYHNSGQTSTDPTIGTCWDADRLDLPRCGLVPEMMYFSTAVAREWVRQCRYTE